jgi:MFS family permease
LIGFVSDRLGRKWPRVGASLVSIAGVGVQYGATSQSMLLAGKMINGSAIGCRFATATAWASEISPMRLHGPIQSAIILCMFFMQAIGLVFVRILVSNTTPKSYRAVFALQWAWPILTGLLFAFMPELLTWLLLQNKSDAARHSLARLHDSIIISMHDWPIRPWESVSRRNKHFNMVQAHILICSVEAI